MKKLVMMAAIAALLAASMARAAAETPNPGFDKLKMLVGAWETKDENGKPFAVTYRMVSGDSAMVEEMENGMISVYHPDDAAVMMTHYCMAKNQPRMRATGLSKDGNKLNFKFVDATNASASSMGMMNHLKITFLDADHFTEEWTNSKDGKETPWTFNFTRKK